MSFNQPLVIDNGSGTIKAGIAGEEHPKVLLPTMVGRPRYDRVMAGGQLDGELFVGAKAVEHRGVLALNHPIEHGIVRDWTDMQHIWTYTYEKLNVARDDHPVLLTEPPLNPRSNRAKAAEIFFEHFAVPAFYVQMQPILALYAGGRTTGVVVDSGDGVTTAVPVYEGFALPHAIQRIDVGGRDITQYLQTLLRKSGYNFHTSAELEVVKQIKEKKCFVTYKLEKAEKAEEQAEKDGLRHGDEFMLPDGKKILIGPEKFRAPEVLFNPALIGLEYPGIHECVVNAIAKSDLDIRRRLYAEIVLSGGSTHFEGLGDRLLSEVRKLTAKDTKIRVYAPKERTLAAWIGGSILASLATFKKMWITKEQFNEVGKSIIYRKTF